MGFYIQGGKDGGDRRIYISCGTESSNIQSVGRWDVRVEDDVNTR